MAGCVWQDVCDSSATTTVPSGLPEDVCDSSATTTVAAAPGYQMEALEEMIQVCVCVCVGGGGYGCVG